MPLQQQAGVVLVIIVFRSSKLVTPVAVFNTDFDFVFQPQH